MTKKLLNEKGQGFLEVMIATFIGLIMLVAFLGPINTLVGTANETLDNSTNLSNTHISTILLSMIGLILVALFILGVWTAFYKPPAQTMGYGGFQ
jgi:hypothetical protein